MAKAVIRGAVTLDGRGVKKGLGQAQKSVDSFTSKVSSLKGALAAAFTVGSVLRFGRSITQLGSEISDFAFQTGLSTDAFQAFEVAAIDAGAGAQAARNGLVRLRQSQSEAISGTGESVKAFERLGLTLEQVANMSMEELITAVGNGFRATQDFGALALLVGSRNAAKLEEAILRVSDGFDEFTLSVKEGGRILSEDFIKDLDAAEDRLLQFQRTAKIAGANVLQGIDAFSRNIVLFVGGLLKGRGVGGALSDIQTDKVDRFAKKLEDRKKRADREEKRSERAGEILDERKREKRQKSEIQTMEKVERQRVKLRDRLEKIRTIKGTDFQFGPFRNVGANLIGGRKALERQRAVDVQKQIKDINIQIRDEVRKFNVGSRF